MMCFMCFPPYKDLTSLVVSAELFLNAKLSSNSNQSAAAAHTQTSRRVMEDQIIKMLQAFGLGEEDPWREMIKEEWM